jgi:glucose/mannose-6-phosphate isomerase
VNGLPLAADRLDDAVLVEAGDPGGMLRQVACAAAHVRIALRAAAEAGVDALTPADRPRAVVVAGPGIAGDALDALCGSASPVQVVSVRGDRLPGWVGAADLVVVTAGGDVPASDPGDATAHDAAAPEAGSPGEAIFAIAEQALRRGCQLAGIGPPAGNSAAPLRDLVRGPYIPAAPGLWPVLTGLLVMAERLGLARVGADGYEDAATALEDISHRCRPASESFVNPAKSLALDLVTGLPVIWGTGPFGAVAARRFASQLNVVAKYPAIPGSLPEAAAGQAALFDGSFAPGPEPDFPSLEDPDGFALDDDSDSRAEIRLVLLADPAAEDPRLASLRAAARSVAEQRGIRVSELAAEGDRPLRRLATLIQLGDYASAYLAIACGIDPSATVAIGDLADPVA